MLTIYWDPNPVIFTLPILGWPIFWYGVLFALGFLIGFPLFVDILTRYLLRCPHTESKAELKAKAIRITDQLSFYMVVATIVGARLGHFLFYENPAHYLSNPLRFFWVREGGLASHGAAIAIIIALMVFAARLKQRIKGLDWIRLLDYVCIPAALAGAFIRFGNFINQEILGTATELPWGVIFAHPADGSLPLARHPVQLYEAFFYLAVFFLLWRLSKKASFLMEKGGLIGLFLILVFGFRFLIEFLKTEQSQILSTGSPLTMGQILSLPLILIGCILFFFRKNLVS